MGELFNDYYWSGLVMNEIKRNSHHTFQLLSKRYYMLPDFIYPKNVWLGISVTNQEQTYGIPYLLETDAEIKFISFEPLTEEINVSLRGIDWIIIGAQTNPLKLPKPEWITLLIKEATRLKIPIFLKDNLKPLWVQHHLLERFKTLYKEFPGG